jgi:hypothetical protein
MDKPLDVGLRSLNRGVTGSFLGVCHAQIEQRYRHDIEMKHQAFHK